MKKLFLIYFPIIFMCFISFGEVGIESSKIDYYIHGYLADLEGILEESKNAFVVEIDWEPGSKKEKVETITNSSLIASLADLIYNDAKEDLEKNLSLTEEGRIKGKTKILSSGSPRMTILFKNTGYNLGLFKFGDFWEVHMGYNNSYQLYTRRCLSDKIESKIAKLLQQGGEADPIIRGNFENEPHK